MFSVVLRLNNFVTVENNGPITKVQIKEFCVEHIKLLGQINSTHLAR